MINSQFSNNHENDFSNLIEVVPDNTVIWRYMPFDNFKYLVENGKSYFCRIDQFNDSFEGEVPQKTNEKNIVNANRISSEEDTEAGKVLKSVLPLIELSAKNCNFANCWHMNECESKDMWENKEIVIKTKVEKLIKSFKSYKQDKIYMGKVKYIDHATYGGVSGHIFAPAFYKQKKYEYEKELRVSIIREEYISITCRNLPRGIPIKTNVKELIEEVYVAPIICDLKKEKIDLFLRKNNLNESKQSKFIL